MPVSTIKEANGNFYHLKYIECQLNGELIHTLFTHSYSVIYMYMYMQMSLFLSDLQQKVSLTKKLRMETLVHYRLVSSIKELERFICEQWSMHWTIFHALKDDLLKSARFTKFQERENASFSQIQYFVKTLVHVYYFAYMYM